MKLHGGPSYKIVLVGESGVGKSTLMYSFINGSSQQNLKPTVGVQFLSKKIPISESTSLTFNIWDTAGSEKYRSVVKNFYRGSSAVIIVYSITNASSFDKIGFWYEEAKENSNNNSVIFVVGTHLDREESRKVQKAQLYEWSAENEVELIDEISALDVDQVENIFRTLTEKLYLDKLPKEGEYDKKSNRKSFASLSVYTTDSVEEQEKKCCH